MAISTELTTLFETLASNLQNVDPTSGNEDDENDVSQVISNLNLSLNLSETNPRVTILDTALSLMCFTAPQVYESLVEDTVNTIVAVLSPSVQCKALRVGKSEVLRVGGLISCQDCGGVVQACVDILEKLDGRGDLSPTLLYAVVRVAALASHFEFALGLDTSTVDANYFQGCKCSVRKLLHHIPKELNVKSGEMPLRLLLWYLDSAILKDDLSQILQEATRRPLLCLSMEFHQRTEWRSLIICFALAPTMFVEARALLHNWFLLTGLASILKLQTELVEAVLDILSRPMSWGLPEEIGSRMPFSPTYFPYPHQQVRTFAGPLSWESLQFLFHQISQLSNGEHYDTTYMKAAVQIKLVDHKSLWATAMNFPIWFYFASVLLFVTTSMEDHFCLKSIGSLQTDQLTRVEVPYSATAARFIAWLFSPANKTYQDRLVENLSNLSVSWSSHSLSSKSNEVSINNKGAGKPGLNHQDTGAFLEVHAHKISNWLREFRGMSIKYHEVGCLNSGVTHISQADISQQSLLFRRIPLGIMIGYFDSVDESGYELLLHYAAAGTILPLARTQQPGGKQVGRRPGANKVSLKDAERFTAEDAVKGVSVVFELTDVIENMGDHLFETEETGQNFVYRVKLKAGKYLHKCLERILQTQNEKEDRLEMFRDIYNGMGRWRTQGPDVLQDHKGLNDVFQRFSFLMVSS